MSVATRGVQAISTVMAWIAGALIIVILVITVAEVVARYVFNSTTGGSIEIGELLLALVVFLSVPYAQQARAHVSTSLVTDRLPFSVAKVVRLVGMTIVLAVLLWAVVATYQRGIASWESQESTFGIRSVALWPGRLMVPVGLTMLAAELVLTMREIAIARGPEDTPVEPSPHSA